MEFLVLCGGAKWISRMCVFVYVELQGRSVYCDVGICSSGQCLRVMYIERWMKYTCVDVSIVAKLRINCIAFHVEGTGKKWILCCGYLQQVTVWT